MGFDWDVIMGVSSGSLFLDIIIIGRNSKANKFTKRLNDPPMNDFIYFRSLLSLNSQFSSRVNL